MQTNISLGDYLAQIHQRYKSGERDFGKELLTNLHYVLNDTSTTFDAKEKSMNQNIGLAIAIAQTEDQFKSIVITYLNSLFENGDFRPENMLQITTPNLSQVHELHSSTADVLSEIGVPAETETETETQTYDSTNSQNNTSAIVENEISLHTSEFGTLTVDDLVQNIATDTTDLTSGDDHPTTNHHEETGAPEPTNTTRGQIFRLDEEPPTYLKLKEFLQFAHGKLIQCKTSEQKAYLEADVQDAIEAGLANTDMNIQINREAPLFPEKIGEEDEFLAAVLINLIKYNQDIHFSGETRLDPNIDDPLLEEAFAHICPNAPKPPELR